MQNKASGYGSWQGSGYEGTVDHIKDFVFCPRTMGNHKKF